MVALGLVTTEHLEGELTLVPGRGAICWRRLRSSVTRLFFPPEIQTKRQERKRRSTANPAYSGLFEPEVRHTLPVPLRDRGSDVRVSVVTFFLLPVCAAA